MKSTKPPRRAKKKPQAPVATRPADNMSEAELAQVRREALDALHAIQQDSVARGLDKMTMEEIDEIIAEVRRSRKR